jgi:hypothetical protein
VYLVPSTSTLAALAPDLVTMPTSATCCSAATAPPPGVEAVPAPAPAPGTVLATA